MLILKTQSRSQAALIVEQQALFGATGFKVQGVAVALQGCLGFFQRQLFGAIQKPLGDQVREPVGMRQAPA